jgi:hypothetical protein
MSTTGCGCGGGCGGCGGTRSAAVGVALDGAFARPEFFAGQLLTDKDLDDLAAYVRGKNRLHNRYLHGAGVVCGLDVSPIGERSVRVSAGYVLDCCGDDIVVPCDVTVDLIALLDDLPAGCGPIGTKDEPERKYELRIEYAVHLGRRDGRGLRADPDPRRVPVLGLPGQGSPAEGADADRAVAFRRAAG